jgi:hypothetical protein
MEDVRKELFAFASAGETVTYGHIMKKFGISRGHPKGLGIGGILGQIDIAETRRGAPGFAAIVVRKDTRFPSGGFFCGDDVPPRLRKGKREATDPRLTEAQKRYVRERQRRIWRYYKKVR